MHDVSLLKKELFRIAFSVLFRIAFSVPLTVKAYLAKLVQSECSIFLIQLSDSFS